MTYHDIPIDKVLSVLKADKKNGYTAKQAQVLLKKNGENVLAEKKPKSIIIKLFEQFKDFMIIILLLAALISFITSIIEGNADFVDPIIILIIVVLNAVLGVVQENKAEKSLAELKKMSSPTANVKRDGVVKTISSKEVVVGDIILLNSGMSVCADCRLISSINLQVDESSLTGESIPVVKIAEKICNINAVIGDRYNCVYSSTSIISGRGEAVVTKTGMHTEVGKIAGLILSTDEKQTPLQNKLAQVGKVLGISALCICSFIFALGLWKGIPPFEMFMTSVSLAVAAIPEGLPAIVTIMLAIGVQRMVKHGAIVRNLPSVETLGSASVICSDKTGTLTQNKMKVTSIVSDDEILTLQLATLCCDCSNTKGNGSNNPTENAILIEANERSISKQSIDKKFPRIDEIPFDSKRKRMTTIHRYHGVTRIITKGAVDLILNLCTHYYDGTKKIILTDKQRKQILSENNRLASKALRVIGVAFSDNDYVKVADSEKNLTYVGMIGMVDPPRLEVYDAVKMCKKANIRPVMITGDHAVTAAAIAKEIGIISDNESVITGEMLDKMQQFELEKNIETYNVFARVTPEHKIRIVKAFQKKGHIVAMTGDGVNDAPALKAADIGCSMGISGTDVAKGASDMILTDDNFATIVEAVRQGRSIFSNIKKAVQFLLSSNIGEIMTILTGILFGWAPPLVAIQLLWVNLVTDSLPAIALGLDPVDKYIMLEKPRDPKKSLFSDGLGITIILEGLMIGALALLAFSIGRNIFDTTEIPWIGRTMAFAVLSISQLVHAFNMRSERSVFSVGIFSNKYLVGAFIVGLILQISVITIGPLSVIFKVIALSPIQWLIVGMLSMMPLLIVELQKRVSGVK